VRNLIRALVGALTVFTLLAQPLPSHAQQGEEIYPPLPKGVPDVPPPPPPTPTPTPTPEPYRPPPPQPVRRLPPPPEPTPLPPPPPIETQVPVVQGDLAAQVRQLQRLVEQLRAGGGAPRGALDRVRDHVKVGGSVTMRFDYTRTADQQDQLLGDTLNQGLRGAVRLSFDYDDPESPVAGGIRLSLAENPNPAGKFIFLGGGFTSKAFNLDRFFALIRPLADRERLKFYIGKMPLPYFRIGGGSWRSEIVWDDDVNPEGAAMQAILYKNSDDKPSFQLFFNSGYHPLEDLQQFRFRGLTGATYMFVEQLGFLSKYVAGAGSYTDYENLNNGLVSPVFEGGRGGRAGQSNAGGVTAAFLPSPGVTQQNAFLLRPGFQRTNNQRNFGPQSNGFFSDAFRVMQLDLNFTFPLSSEALGNPKIWLGGTYVRNFGVAVDNQGYQVAIGINGGNFAGATLNPFNVWFTWKDVDADATLATIADSDLCAGTGCRGIEVGVNYRFFKHFAGQVHYYDFTGFPNKDNHIQRVFVDGTVDW
jgi:hypothetical protein